MFNYFAQHRFSLEIGDTVYALLHVRAIADLHMGTEQQLTECLVYVADAHGVIIRERIRRHEVNCELSLISSIAYRLVNVLRYIRRSGTVVQEATAILRISIYLIAKETHDMSTLSRIQRD